MLKRLSFLWILGLALWLEPATAETAQPPLPAAPLVIESGTARHVFQAELALTPETRQKGLMFRRSLPEDAAMLFLFDAPQQAAMWMQNTYIPLDMLYISKAGVIVDIAENAEPLSQAILKSLRPALAVLEVNGGTAARLGIKAGDRVVIDPWFPEPPPAPPYD